MKYKKVKHIPTKKLKEIIDDPYYRSICGTDYGPIIEEIKEIYFKRIQLKEETELEKQLKEAV